MTKLVIESDSADTTVLVFDNNDEFACEKLRRIERIKDAYICLWDIDQKCRSYIKHPPDWDEGVYDAVEKILQEIRDLIWEAQLDL